MHILNTIQWAVCLDSRSIVTNGRGTVVIIDTGGHIDYCSIISLDIRDQHIIANGNAAVLQHQGAEQTAGSFSQEHIVQVTGNIHCKQGRCLNGHGNHCRSQLAGSIKINAVSNFDLSGIGRGKRIHYRAIELHSIGIHRITNVILRIRQRHNAAQIAAFQTGSVQGLSVSPCDLYIMTVFTLRGLPPHHGSVASRNGIGGGSNTLRYSNRNAAHIRIRINHTNGIGIYRLAIGSAVFNNQLAANVAANILFSQHIVDGR